MRVEVFYEGGRIDCLDTDQFTEPRPFSGRNVLTDYELHREAMREQGLWLACHCYDLGATVEGETCAGTAPAVQRATGWQMLLVPAASVPAVLRIAVNGTTVSARHRGRLVDVAALDALMRSLVGDMGHLSLDAQICELAARMAQDDQTLKADPARLARTMGIEPGLLSEVLSAGIDE